MDPNTSLFSGLAVIALAVIVVWMICRWASDPVRKESRLLLDTQDSEYSQTMNFPAVTVNWVDVNNNDLADFAMRCDDPLVYELGTRLKHALLLSDIHAKEQESLAKSESTQDSAVPSATERQILAQSAPRHSSAAAGACPAVAPPQGALADLPPPCMPGGGFYVTVGGERRYYMWSRIGGGSDFELETLLLNVQLQHFAQVFETRPELRALIAEALATAQTTQKDGRGLLLPTPPETGAWTRAFRQAERYIQITQGRA